MNRTKEVAFRNYDADAGFYFDQTVEAKVWKGDETLDTGYWVVDDNYWYGSSIGKDASTLQIDVVGDAKVIIEDGSSLTLTYDNSYDSVGTTDAMISVNHGNYFTLYGQEESTGKLDIEGNNKAASGEYSKGGAALGSDGGKQTGSITINGCQVIASSNTNAAAIGGGYDGEIASNCADGLTINGGDVTATIVYNGQEDQNEGAAIGSGKGGTANGITINSGHVTATGYHHGAGIGSGDGGSCFNITINGGSITALGGDSAAGIGTGYAAKCGSYGFTINNGYVHAEGGGKTGSTGTQTGSGGAGIGAGYQNEPGKKEGDDEDAVVTYFVSQIYINGGYVYAVRGNGNVIKEYGESGEEGDHSWALGRGDGDDTYPVNYVYVSGEMKLTTISVNTSSWTTVTDVVSHSSGTELAKGGADYSPLYQKDTVECVTIRLTYNDILEKSCYEITAGKSNIGYYEGGVDGGGYIYVTNGMSVINSKSVTFSNIYVNGDTAHGGVICADEAGGIINLVDVDFNNNKVIHNYTEAAGGAIYSNGAYETTLVRCDFTNNMASGYRLRSYGGAVAVTGEGLLTVKDATFTANKATSEGGAVWNNHSFVITGSEFLDGYANKGGAVYAAASDTLSGDSKRIIDTTFTNNTANFGGALYVEAGTSVQIEDSKFDGNSAHTYGYDAASGAEDLGEHQGGAAYVAGDAVISGTDFTGNYAKQGGGLYVAESADVAVSNADFTENEAAEEGGAIYVEKGGTLALKDVYFSDNKSITQNCAVYNAGEINLTGRVTVDAYASDVFVNRGRVNWDTNGETANGFFSNITRFDNAGSDSSRTGAFVVTVNDGDLEGVTRYVLAENADFGALPEETADTLKSFVLSGIAGEADKVIVADGNAVEYNGKTYRLYTTDAAQGNQLVLAVESGETERTSHIVVDREHFNAAVLNTSGEFTGFKYFDEQGGAVLLTEGAVFSAHDSVFSGNEATAGGAIYAVADSQVNLTNVTFTENVSRDGASGALYIAEGATVTLYGDVTLSTASDTIANDGTLVWSIGTDDNGYLSDYSLLSNGASGALVIENAPTSAYGKYRLADNAKSANGATFTLGEGGSDAITVNSEDWVSCGNMEARVYVDEDQKYSLWLEVRATRIDVSLETYTMQDGYVVDMTGSSAHEGDGGLIYVHRNGRLENDGSAKVTGVYATGNGGAVYSEGNVKLSHAKFIDNHSYGKGGAIYGEGIKLTLTDSTFSGNASDDGGAIWNMGGTTILDNVTFSCNSAIGDGGAIYGGDIDLRGDVYLSSESDTIWIEEDKTLNWTIDGNDNGYLSDFSLITGNMTAETFTIDAEDASVGHCYTLAGNAATSDGKTFTITVTGADDIKEYTMTVNGETLLVNDVSYVLGVNDSNELTLSVNQHIVVEDYTLLINSIQDFSWAGMDTYTGNGSIFEIKADGIMTNVFLDGETTSSYATSFKDGSVGKDDQRNGGNGGIIYNEANVTLDSAYFESNTAEGNGGAIYSSNTMYVTNGSFLYNDAEYGGAVYVAGGTTNYLSGTFESNTATEKGGAVYLASGAALSLGDATFSGNEADEGGAIYSEGEILLTGELVLSSSDDSFINYGTVTLDYASDASIRGYQYLANLDEGASVCISVAGLESGQEIWQYAFAKGDFFGDYEYVDEFTLTDGTLETTIKIYGGQVEFNGLNYIVDINETGDALILNAYAKKNLTVTLNDTEKKYDGVALTGANYDISGTLASTDELILTFSDTITDVGSKYVQVSGWKVLRDGADVSYEYDLSSVGGATLTVTPREITVTSGSAVKVYDGTSLSCDTITVSGDGFVGKDGITCTATGVQDGVGVSENTFTYSFNEGTKAENYAITEKKGLLSVKALNPREITITVDNLSKTYDGTSLQATYQYTQGVLAEGDELVVLLDNTSLTDAGKVEVSVADYRVMRGDEDVTDGYTFTQSVSGSLEVTKRAVTFTTGSAEKFYDGTPLVCDTITVTGDGFANGEGATYAATGSQTEVGKSKNTASYTLNEGTKAANYAITAIEGDLTVVKPETSITITAASDSKLYDGTALTNANYTFTNGVLIAGDVLTATVEGTITDAGKAVNTVTGYKVMRGDVDVTACYLFNASVDGELEVTKRSVTLTSGSATKKYDGTALTNDTVAVTGDGWANGEGATYSVTGTQTEVGSSNNVFGYSLNANTKASNYDIETRNGTLVVEASLTDPLIVSGVSVQLPADAAVSTATVKEDGTLTLTNGAKLAVSGVTTLADGTLDASLGAFETAELRATTGENAYLGATTGIADATVYGGATLDLSRSQYDELFDRDALAVDAAGLVKVAGGDDVSVGDVLDVVASDRVDAVEFAADLDFAINKLGFYATKTVVNKTTYRNVGTDEAKAIGFGDAVGTVKSDTITFGAGTDLALGTEGKTLDLLAGTNTVKVEKNADAEVASDLVNVTKVTLAAGTKVKNAVTGAKEQQRTALDLADVTFSADRAGTFSTGRYADVTAGDLTGSEAKGLSLTLGMDGTFAAGDVSNVRKLTVGSGRSSGGAANFSADSLTGTAKGDTVSFGVGNTAVLGVVSLGAGNDTFKLGNEATAVIDLLDFGEGTSDKLTLGKGSSLTVTDLDVASLDKLSIGKDSTLYLGTQDLVDAAQTKFYRYADQIQLAAV